jgi:ATP-dependent Clp protease ATP-binding subunit ClpB
VVAGVDLALGKMPKVSGDAGPGLSGPATGRVLDEAEKIAKKAGDSFVPVERILMALAMVKSKAKEALDAGAVTAQALNRDQRHPQGPHRRQRQRRGRL